MFLKLLETIQNHCIDHQTQGYIDATLLEHILRKSDTSPQTRIQRKLEQHDTGKWEGLDT